MFDQLTINEHPTLQHKGVSGVFAATPSDAGAIAAALTVAFSSDPVTRWAWPSASTFLEWFPRFVRVFGGRAFETRSAYSIEGIAGAALWLPPGVGPDEEALVELVERSTDGSRRDDLMRAFEAMGQFHPSEPHWYLPLIGVESLKQGSGIGTRLMAHALERCDIEGLPAYLESTNPRNISLYARFGFEVIGQIQVGDSPPIFPMLRTARGWFSLGTPEMA